MSPGGRSSEPRHWSIQTVKKPQPRSSTHLLTGLVSSIEASNPHSSLPQQARVNFQIQKPMHTLLQQAPQPQQLPGAWKEPSTSPRAIRESLSSFPARIPHLQLCAPITTWTGHQWHPSATNPMPRAQAWATLHTIAQSHREDSNSSATATARRPRTSQLQSYQKDLLSSRGSSALTPNILEAKACDC